MQGRTEPRNLDKKRNFANWPAELGKIFRGKLRALEISNKMHTTNQEETEMGRSTQHY